MKLLIVNDNTWDQVNGVVTTFKNVGHCLDQKQIDWCWLDPSQFTHVKGIGYPDLHVPINVWKLAQLVDAYGPTHVHIGTEGVLGMAAKMLFDHRSWSYTTSFHTRWDKFAQEAWGFTPWGVCGFLKYFHEKSKRVLVTTPGMQHEVQELGISNVEVWSRGVDPKLFQFGPGSQNMKPRLLSVGRVSAEKNLRAFCELDPRTYDLVMVGHGPQLAELQRAYPHVQFLGALHGAQLAHTYASADVLVFTSRGDTFGLVMIEAMACGTPVAAYPVRGPIDVIDPGETGHMHVDLTQAISECLKLDRLQVRGHSHKFSWQTTTDKFLASLVSIT